MLSNILRVLLPAALVLVASYPAESGTDESCLRSNRIFSWEVRDDRTLIVTDMSRKRYKVAVVGTCIGLDNTKFAIAFETLSEMSCLRAGDVLRYHDPVFGPQRCPIAFVEIEAPPAE
jgi:hypothetical protein